MESNLFPLQTPHTRPRQRSIIHQLVGQATVSKRWPFCSTLPWILLVHPVVPLPFIWRHERPTRRPETGLDQLLKLDSWINPGISEADFGKLFARCCCGIITTTRVFKDHICATPIVPDIIDLTGDVTEDEAEAGDVRAGRFFIDLTSDSDDNSQ